MPQMFITKLVNFPPDTYARIMSRCRTKGENNVTRMILDLLDYGLDNMPVEEGINQSDLPNYEPPPLDDLSFEEQLRRAGLSEDEIQQQLKEAAELLRRVGDKR